MQRRGLRDAAGRRTRGGACMLGRLGALLRDPRQRGGAGPGRERGHTRHRRSRLGATSRQPRNVAVSIGRDGDRSRPRGSAVPTSSSVSTSCHGGNTPASACAGTGGGEAGVSTLATAAVAAREMASVVLLVAVSRDRLLRPEPRLTPPQLPTAAHPAATVALGSELLLRAAGRIAVHVAVAGHEYPRHCPRRRHPRPLQPP